MGNDQNFPTIRDYPFISRSQYHIKKSPNKFKMSSNSSRKSLVVGHLPWTSPEREERIYTDDLYPHTEPLTFGVEIEFYLMTDIRTMDEADWKGTNASCDAVAYQSSIRARRILLPLTQAGVMVADLEDVPKIPQSTIDTHFILKPDFSIVARGEEINTHCVFVGIELSSPPLEVNSDSFQLIHKVLHLLKSCGARINDSCGLHVHLGNRTNTGFSFKTMKLLAHITTIAGEQLSQLHRVERVHNYYAAFPNMQFATNDTYVVANTIEDLKTYEELILRYHVPLRLQNSQQGQIYQRHTAVNYLPMRGPFRTIEFRSHAGTLNEKEVIRWIRTVALLLRRSSVKQNPYVEITKKIKAARQDGESYSVLDLFTDLEAPVLAKDWEGDIHDHALLTQENIPSLALP